MALSQQQTDADLKNHKLLIKWACFWGVVGMKYSLEQNMTKIWKPKDVFLLEK